MKVKDYVDNIMSFNSTIWNIRLHKFMKIHGVTSTLCKYPVTNTNTRTVHKICLICIDI